MYFNNRILCNELNQYQKIIIYGTGDFAQKIYPQLIEFNLRKKIVCFTQTEGNGSASIDGIPVINIKKLNYSKAECVVLVAVSELYADEIKQTLLEFEYPHIVFLTDYRVRYKLLETNYHDLVSFEEYCEYIADWYMRTQKDNQNNGRIMQEIWGGREWNVITADNNLIVMICGEILSRTNKIIRALIKKKYKVVLLSYFGTANPWNLKELEKMGIEWHQCQYIAEMLYYALQYHPLVYFFVPRWGDCLWAEIMLKNKKHFGKVILALYDVMNDGYTGRIEKDLATEKYALEHADGVVWRWFSKEYLEEKGFIFQGKSIQFVDYCYYESENDISDNGDSSVVKICFISGYGDEYVENRIHTTGYTAWARIGEILERIGNRTDCVFHFYVGELLYKENIIRCEQYEKQYKNFKFFLATEHDELVKRLQDYDYGCELWIDGDAPPDDMPMGEYYGSIYKNSVRNAYFDFLSAGLPVITTQASKMWEYLCADDVIIKMTLSELDVDYLKKYKHFYKAKAKERRKEWNIDNQIMKLTQFFREVSECKV